MNYRRDLLHLAASNHGIVTTQDGDDVGVPAVEMRKMAGRGVLQRYGRGVYRHLDLPPTPWTDAAAVTALAGPESFLQGDTVLAMHDLANVSPRRIQVGTLARRPRMALPVTAELTVRRDICSQDVVWYHGLRCLNVAQVLRDRADYLIGERLREATRTALRHDLIDADDEAALLSAAF